MTLIDVYGAPEASRALYDLLAEREPHQNISHKEMPSFEAHCAFVASRPYRAWYLIVDDAFADERAPLIVGGVYITKADEVGLFVFKAHRGKGYGRQAVYQLRKLHPGRLLANIAPNNVKSQTFFERQGFRHIQSTYERT